MQTITFAVCADIQYCSRPFDQKLYETKGRRPSESLDKLLQFVQHVNNSCNVQFVMHLGDVIDGHPKTVENYQGKDLQDLQHVASVMQKCQVPWYHTLGNHCLYHLPRSQVMQTLPMPNNYYTLTKHNYLFVVLDGTEFSVLAGNTENVHLYKQAKQYYAQHKGMIKGYNGTLGPEQVQWLQATLKQAQELQQRVIVCCHWSAVGRSNLWKSEELIVPLLQQYNSCIFAWLHGHLHRNSYKYQYNVHFIGMHAIITAPKNGNAFAMVHIDTSTDSMHIDGAGTQQASYKNLQFHKPWHNKLEVSKL